MTYDPAGPVQPANFAPLGPNGDRVVSLAYDHIRRWADLLRRGSAWAETEGDNVINTLGMAEDEVPDGSDFFLKCFRHDQSGDLSVVFSLSRHWDRSAVSPILRCIPLSSGSGTLVFRASYQWLGTGMKVVEFPEGGYSSTSLTPNEQLQSVPVTLGTIAPPRPLPGVGNKLLVFVHRVSSRDDYDTDKAWGTAEANVALLGVSLAYRRRLFGTEGIDR